jgi:hypothetical protein
MLDGKPLARFEADPAVKRFSAVNIKLSPEKLLMGRVAVGYDALASLEYWPLSRFLRESSNSLISNFII